MMPTSVPSPPENIDVNKSLSRKLKACIKYFAIVTFIIGFLVIYRDTLPVTYALAHMGNSHAQAKLGTRYWTGDQVVINAQTALKWWNLAAEDGNAASQIHLGNLYQRGYGVPPDLPRAISLFKKAAEQDNAFAQYSLGLLYKNGDGVKQSDGEAAFWYKKAATLGNEMAQNNLGNLYLNGLGVEKDINEAVNLFKLAARNGNVTAQNTLGRFYERGGPVQRDSAESIKWFKIAAETSKKNAAQTLKAISPLKAVAERADIEKFALSREQMLADLHETKERAKAHPENFKASFASELALSLARYYIHSGQIARGLKEFEDVRLLAIAREALQVYAGLILELISTGDKRAALDLIKNMKDMTEKIREIDENFDSHLNIKKNAVEKRGRTEEEPYYGEYEVCEISKKAFALKQDFESLEVIHYQTPCKFALHTYIPALLVNKKFIEAYKKIAEAITGYDKPIGPFYHYLSMVEACAPASNVDISKQEVAALLAEGRGLNTNKDDWQKTTLALLLVTIGAVNEGESFTSRISNIALRQRIYWGLFTHYYLKNDRLNTFRIAHKMGFFESLPSTRTPGVKNFLAPPHTQAKWLWTKHLTPLAIEMASQIKNPQSKFFMLLSIYAVLDKYPEIKITLCPKMSEECLIDEMKVLLDPESGTSRQKDMMLRSLFLVLNNRNDPSVTQRFNDYLKDKSLDCFPPLCNDSFKKNKVSDNDEKLECDVILRDSPHNIFNQIKVDNQQGKFTTSKDYFKCVVKSGEYKTYLQDPLRLGLIRDAYFSEALNQLRLNSNSSEEMFEIVAAMEKTSARKTAIIDWFHFSIIAPNNPSLSKMDNKFNYKGMMQGILNHPVLKNDIELIKQLLERVYSGNSPMSANKDDMIEQRKYVEKLIGDFPQLGRELMLVAAYHGSLCPVLKDYLPKPFAMAIVADGYLEDSFNSCIRQLVSTKDYTQALYQAANMYVSKDMKAVAEQVILDDIFRNESENFARSERTMLGYNFLRNSSLSGVSGRYSNSGTCPMEPVEAGEPQ